ncbi:hypothetical protein GCK32_017965 [Trichostrongylus colubriformis]|uniref:Uncharacterized protein n=1 Tax=Trichostrongylus colubriformis TaxID=6319 RepID=A0AAN8G6D0_TRICO
MAVVPRPFLKWNKTMSDQALQEAIVKGSVIKEYRIIRGHREDTPYLMYHHKKEFRKIDRLSLKEKVRETLESEEFMLSGEHPLDNIGGNTYFGCNGHGEEKDDKEYMRIVCFIERRIWYMSDNGTRIVEMF